MKDSDQESNVKDSQIRGVCCSDCGRVLPHKVAKLNPEKDMQPINGPVARHEGVWLEAWPCPHCAGSKKI